VIFILKILTVTVPGPLSFERPVSVKSKNSFCRRELERTPIDTWSWIIYHTRYSGDSFQVCRTDLYRFRTESQRKPCWRPCGAVFDVRRKLAKPGTDL